MNRFRPLVLAACAPLLLLAACADAPPTGVEPLSRPPGDASATLAAAGGLDVAALARFDQRPAVTIAWAKKWIGPEGGRLDFQGFAVEVPPGAVSRVTQFSIHLPVDPQGSERVVADFGPHGAVFVRPVAIELPYAGTSIFGRGGTVVWGNKSTGAWEDYGAEPTADGRRLRTTTHHFSTYGTRGTGLVASGG